LPAEIECTQYEIMVVQGNSDPKSGEIYTGTARRSRLAIATMGKVSEFKL